PSQGSFGEIGPVKPTLSCFLLGMLALLPTLVVVFWALRRAFVTAAHWRGAAIGPACGLGGSLMLNLHCGNPYGGHLALAHGLPVLLGAVLGALAGTRISRA